MLNEKEEFLAYTGKVNYTACNKQDSSFLGRFTFEMLTDFIGLYRVFTIIARGYMFESDKADIDRARKALLAWCSVPDKKRDLPKKEGQSETNFRFLHEQFPELVDSAGNGWFYTHIQNIQVFVKANPEKVSKTAIKKADTLKGFEKEWRKKLMQYQVPLYSVNTKGSFLLLFDDVLADALELGELQNKDFELHEEVSERLIASTPKGVPETVLPILYKYYITNKQENTDWVVLPVSNFDAFFGTTAFSRKYLPMLKTKGIIKTETAYGVGKFKFVNYIFV